MPLPWDLPLVGPLAEPVGVTPDECLEEPLRGPLFRGGQWGGKLSLPLKVPLSAPYCTHYRSAYIYTYIGGSRNISPHIIISYHIVYDYIKLIWESHSNSRHMQKPKTNTRPNQSHALFFSIIANGGTNL